MNWLKMCMKKKKLKWSLKIKMVCVVREKIITFFTKFAIFSDKEEILMPPPPPVTDQSTSQEKPAEVKVNEAAKVATPQLTTQTSNPDGSKREAPLAAMLPSKYEGVDVKTLFPDFNTESVNHDYM
jgi:hypothetical protein